MFREGMLIKRIPIKNTVANINEKRTILISFSLSILNINKVMKGVMLLINDITEKIIFAISSAMHNCSVKYAGNQKLIDADEISATAPTKK